MCIVAENTRSVNITRRRLVAQATRRSSVLGLKESFLSQLLFPTMHEMVNDGQYVFYVSVDIPGI